MRNTQMMQLQVLQQHEDMLNSHLEVISWTNISPKDIPTISSTAEAARYPMHIDFFIVIMSCYLGKAKDWSCLRLWVNPWQNLSNCSSSAVSVQTRRLKTSLGPVEVAVTSLDCSRTLPKTTIPALEFSVTVSDHTVWICTPHNLIFTQLTLNLQMESSFASPCLSLAEKSPCYSQTQTWFRLLSLTCCKDSNS